MVTDLQVSVSTPRSVFAFNMKYGGKEESLKKREKIAGMEQSLEGKEESLQRKREVWKEGRSGQQTKCPAQGQAGRHSSCIARARPGKEVSGVNERAVRRAHSQVAVCEKGMDGREGEGK